MNKVSFNRSSRSLLLKLSMKAFCVAALGDDGIEFATDPNARQGCVGDQHETFADEVIPSARMRKRRLSRRRGPALRKGPLRSPDDRAARRDVGQCADGSARGGGQACGQDLACDHAKTRRAFPIAGDKAGARSRFFNQSCL